MKLELELQALSKVYQDMRRNEYTMTYLQNILNANHFSDEVWKGRGKDAYLSLEKNLQNEEKAKEYLQNTEMKTYEISEAVGVEDAGYFSKMFKKITGVSPKEFRKREQHEEKN
mgnify:CR=1 FL=1